MTTPSVDKAAKRFAPFEPNLIEVVQAHARWRPVNPALITATETVSWAQLWSRVRALARALQCDGLEPEQTVAVLSGNHADTVVSYLGVVAAGGVVAPLSNQVPPSSLRAMMLDGDARYLIADDTGVEHIGDTVGKIPGLRAYVWAGETDTPDLWKPTADLLQADDGSDPVVTITPESPFSLIYTSGTTGTPKGMVHNHRARLAFASRFAQAFEIAPESIVVSATALFTTGTWLMLLPALHAGASIAILPAFSPAAFQEAVIAHWATHTFLVPTAYQALLDYPDLDTEGMGTMTVWVSAGSALRAETKSRIDSILPGQLIEMYGCSEGFTTVCSPADRSRAEDLSAVGYPPFGWEVRVIREDGTEAAREELGELVGLSEFMLSHYHNRPEATAEAIWRDERGRTFIRSGDIGRIGDDGQVYVVDRKKDVINSGGLNVFAADIEEVLLACPEVEEVAVVAAPHEKWGETPVAFVVPRDTEREIDVDGLLRRVNAEVAKYQRLSRIVLSEPLPRNALGKVLKRELRDPLWRDTPGKGAA
jgi:acyl-CoA synthetase (AMP-forming)/AMP-acid ligase II